VFHSASSNRLKHIPPYLWSEILYSLSHLLEFHITNGAVLHLCWAHRVFHEVATKRYVLPNKELIYKGLCDYFSGQSAKIHNDDINQDNGANYDQGCYFKRTYVVQSSCRKGYVASNISKRSRYFI